MRLDGEQALRRHALNESAGVGYGQTFVIHEYAHPPQSRVISVPEGIHERLAECPAIELGHRLPE